MSKNLLTVNELFEKYCLDKDHAVEVVKYSNMIFDALNSKKLNLSEQDKILLNIAAKLHDIGYSVEKKSHHKHTMNIILQNGIKDYSQQDITIIANIARYHRNSFPDINKHENFAALGPQIRKKVEILAGILRLADGLDKPHKNLILRLRTEENSNNLTFIIKSIGFKPGLKAAENKKDLLENILKKTITFKIE